MLHSLSIIDSPYGLTVSDDHGFFSADNVINACGGSFFIGRPTCTWCPSAQVSGLCGLFENITALSGSSAMVGSPTTPLNDASVN